MKTELCNTAKLSELQGRKEAWKAEEEETELCNKAKFQEP